MSTPQADWYPDPEVSGQLRYWDGAHWTEHRAPAPAQQQAATFPYRYESRIAGRNAHVLIWQDRIEWTHPGSFSLSQRGKGSDMVPLRMVTGVSTRREGLRFSIVSIMTMSGPIEMRVGHDQAEHARQVILSLLLR